MKEKIEKIITEFQQQLKSVSTSEELEKIKLQYFSKKGTIASLFQELKKFSGAEKAKYGKELNQTRASLENIFLQKNKVLEKKGFEEQAKNEWVDISLDIKEQTGALHPLSKLQYELEDIFISMGFLVVDGNHVESDFYNFEALNIPKDHPARDLQDTYYFNKKYLLRTQTSPLQIRAMEKLKPPIRIIAPGKVFRAETRDASHENCFHQLEGMVIDKGITASHLIHFMEVMLEGIFYQQVKVRLRPGYFPFVEPGFELDMSCQICAGKGCKMCKKTGWVEMIGCGMVHPKVLEVGGIDKNIYSGFAFGLGLDRLCLMRHKINDIRHLHSGSIRFIQQFT